jgi:hypothetical protein
MEPVFPDRAIPMSVKLVMLVMNLGIAMMAAFGGTLAGGIAYLVMIGEPVNTAFFNHYFNYVAGGIFVIVIFFLRLTLADQYKFRMERND